jgi:hypothetical protein
MIVELGLWPRNSFSGNICLEFSALVLCSAYIEKKRLAIFPFAAGMSLTKLYLAGNNFIKSLVSDIPAWDGKITNFL